MVYRILSLNGGGVRGIFQAVYLSKIATRLEQKPLWKNFDLIAGTSTGSLLALGTALEIEPDRLVDLFQVHSPSIFKRSLASQAASKVKFVGLLHAALHKGPQYSDAPLRNVLKEIFGNKKLGDCRLPIVVPAANLDQYGHRIFSTLHSGSADYGLSAVDVAMASCAAPSYFPAVKPENDYRTYVDGGVWANSPSLLAVLEAKRHRSDLPFNSIRLVCLGNGETVSGDIGPHYNHVRGWKFIEYVFNLMSSSQATATDYFVETLIGRKTA